MSVRRRRPPQADFHDRRRRWSSKVDLAEAIFQLADGRDRRLPQVTRAVGTGRRGDRQLRVVRPAGRAVCEAGGARTSGQAVRDCGEYAKERPPGREAARESSPRFGGSLEIEVRFDWALGGAHRASRISSWINPNSGIDDDYFDSAFIKFISWYSTSGRITGVQSLVSPAQIRLRS